MLSTREGLFQVDSYAHIQLTRLPIAFPGIPCIYNVLHLLQDVSEDSEDDDLSLLLQIPNKVIALRLKDNTLYQIVDDLRGLAVLNNHMWDGIKPTSILRVWLVFSILRFS